MTTVQLIGGSFDGEVREVDNAPYGDLPVVYVVKFEDDRAECYGLTRVMTGIAYVFMDGKP